ELKKKSPDAFALYQKHFEDLGSKNAPVDAKSLLRNRMPQLDAKSMLRNDLNRMRDEAVDNPQLRDTIQQMIDNINR
ncbi:MAG: hypothetical protein AAFN70_07035, partial [Planctomycetota bacterium]